MYKDSKIIAMTTIKPFQKNQNLALNNTWRVDIILNQTSPFLNSFVTVCDFT